MSIDDPHAYATSFLQAVDERDWETWRSLVTPDIVVRFANQPPMDASTFEAMVDGAVDVIPSVTHRIEAAWGDDWADGDVVIVEMEVTYELANTQIHVLPAVGVIRRRGGLAVDYRVFVDLGPVQASLAMPETQED